MQSLPDVLCPGLTGVFCGINPGMQAALTGHHFAGRSNRFWRVLHLANFTPNLMTPEGGSDLLLHGWGLTTAVARPTARAAQLSSHELVDAISELEFRIRHNAPQHIAFLGKAVYATILHKRDVQWGPQPGTFGGARPWILPNPSGLNRAFSLSALTEAYRELYMAAC